MMNWFWKEKLKVVMMRVNVMENIFPYDITVSVLLLMFLKHSLILF